MDRIKRLGDLLRPFYETDDPAHDWPHIGRVAATAKKLCSGESVNVECVLAAVYCHDLVNLPKNHPDRSRASELAAEKALPFLREVGFSQEEMQIISTAIIEHSFSKGLRPSIREAAIVQDADRLDSLGAIGILRCASVNTLMKLKYYDAFDPFAEVRELNDKEFMLDHYFVKLFKLPDLMTTEAGKKEGELRVEYMKSFLAELGKEIR
jgi:uncharacterized protein